MEDLVEARGDDDSPLQLTLEEISMIATNRQAQAAAPSGLNPINQHTSTPLPAEMTNKVTTEMSTHQPTLSPCPSQPFTLISNTEVKTHLDYSQIYDTNNSPIIYPVNNSYVTPAVSASPVTSAPQEQLMDTPCTSATMLPNAIASTSQVRPPIQTLDMDTNTQGSALVCFPGDIFYCTSINHFTKVEAKVGDLFKLTPTGLVKATHPISKPSPLLKEVSTNTPPQTGTFTGCFQFQYKPDDLFQVNFNQKI
jgi:hypothetical protein